MDAFDFKEERKRRPRRRPRRRYNLADIVWNVGTVYFLVSALCLGGVFLTIFTNPYVSFNPFPPPTPRPVTPLPTIGPTFTPTATWTFTPTLIYPTTSVPLGPSHTPTPPTDTAPTVTGTPPTPTATSESETPFTLQEGTPKWLDSTIYHPELGCNFMGVGGQAINLEGAPLTGLWVELTGTLEGDSIVYNSPTGSATQYGPAGYEIQLADEPIASDDDLIIVLKNLEGDELSEPFTFDTFDDCTRNVVLINFKQVH